MAKKFDKLRQKMSAERRRRNKAEADRLLLDMFANPGDALLPTLTIHSCGAPITVTTAVASGLELDRRGNVVEVAGPGGCC